MKSNKPIIITKAFALALALLLALAGCSPFGGGGGGKTGVITINFGAAEGMRSVMWADNKDVVMPLINEYKVTAAGAETLVRTLGKNETSVSIPVAAGTWNVKVEAFIGGMPVAVGNKTVEVTAGQNTQAVIPMEDASSGGYEIHVVNNVNEWTPAVKSIGGSNNSGHIVILTGDIDNVSPSTDYTFGNAAKAAIYGNGNMITLSGNDSLLRIGAGQTVTIQDVKLQGNVDPNGTGNSSSVVYIIAGGELIMNEGAEITGNNNGNVGGAVNVDGIGASFTMNGGTIRDSSGASAVNVINGAEFTMNDGTIRNNTSGGVYVQDGSKFTMHNGSISNNVGWYSGVRVSASSFTMYGGKINDNNSTNDSGGGVNIIGWPPDGEAVFIMHNGKINGNTATQGGGVFLNSPYSTFTMIDGEIIGNIANGSNGGGVNSGGIFNMEGGTIKGNETTANNGNGGGVYAGGTFTMSGGEITGNSVIAGQSGGGVYISSGSFTMSGDSSINNNTAGSGGGVYVNAAGTGGGNFTMGGGSISENTVSGNGGGVCILGAPGNPSVFTMNNGSITANTAGEGGGLYLTNATCTFNLNAPANRLSITGNTAAALQNVSFGLGGGNFFEDSVQSTDTGGW